MFNNSLIIDHAHVLFIGDLQNKKKEKNNFFQTTRHKHQPFEKCRFQNAASGFNAQWSRWLCSLRYCIPTYTVIYIDTVKRQSIETVYYHLGHLRILVCVCCAYMYLPPVRLKQELFNPEKITCLPLVLASKHAGGDSAMSLFFVINIHLLMTGSDNRCVSWGYLLGCHIRIFLSLFIFYQFG